MKENSFYRLKVSAEISLDIQASNHDMAINAAQKEVMNALQCLFGDKEVSITSAFITGVDE